MKSIIVCLIVCLVSVNANQAWKHWNNTSGSNNSVNATSQWPSWIKNSGFYYSVNATSQWPSWNNSVFNNYTSQYNATSYRKRDASSVITGLGNQLGLSSSLVSQIIGQYNSLNSGIINKCSFFFEIFF